MDDDLGSHAAAMEKTFITMHDLSPEARIVYASDSVTDVLGYPPEDVAGLSCFDFFHPDELPFARKVHTRGIHLDRAAVLVYCRVRHKDGGFVNCETIFSVVYDVFVAATTVHVQTSKSQGRALTAPVIRRVFSSSPNDPRYHMLTHLSTKFRMESSPDQGTHEPRVALILNRFTRSLTILYVSHASRSIFGIAPEELTGKSFFECIHESCLQEAVDALERAKGNDSIAYLRFQWRDPINAHIEQQGHQLPQPSPERPLRRSQRISSQTKRKLESRNSGGSEASSSGRPAKRRGAVPRGEGDSSPEAGPSRPGPNSVHATIPVPPSEEALEASAVSGSQQVGAIGQTGIREAEAVVSCTSDGLVVILRQARPLIPKPLHNVPGGVFASPWAPVPLVPNVAYAPDKSREASFMEAIREVAVFAWSLRQLGGEIITGLENESASARDRGRLDAVDKGQEGAAALRTPGPVIEPDSVEKEVKRERRGRAKDSSRRARRR
ncbi:hypothetical protein DRE_03318 [Drechslerella stenobrocha 248]|uniref:PAS domain-containing protein n=1 Tax=Drechslerella stenobrocha 248 TaxID=1043628 RepID=W7HUL9_9PEZI|nr:hypothetical protein DRE_03318 [Drechslerella stenobrocha 248]